jgi:hypothetical protein
MTQTAAELEARILNGDTSITASDLAEARAAENLVGLQAEGARRKAEQDKVQARLDACTALHDEIQNSAITTGPALAELLRAVDTAARQFVEAVDTRNDQIRDWRKRMKALGVPESSAPVPPAEHGHLGTVFMSSEVIAGHRRVDAIDAQWWLLLCLGRIRPRSGGRTRVAEPPNGVKDVFAALTAVDPAHGEGA